MKQRTKENIVILVAWAAGLLVTLSILERANAEGLFKSHDATFVFGPGKSYEDPDAGYLFGGIWLWRDAGTSLGVAHNRGFSYSFQYNREQIRKETLIPEFSSHTLGIGWEWQIMPNKLLGGQLWCGLFTEGGFLVGDVHEYFGARYILYQRPFCRIGRFYGGPIAHGSNFGTGIAGRNPGVDGWGIWANWLGRSRRGPGKIAGWPEPRPYLASLPSAIEPARKR